MTAPPGTPAPALVEASWLRPAPWNPRRITDTRFLSLVASIEADPDFLWLRPVLATADGTVYGGNMRLRAALHLGMTHVPAVVMDIPDSLAKERALRDNNGWGEWVEGELTDLLDQLRADVPTFEPLAVGFDDAFLDKLLGDVLDLPDGVDSTSRSANPYQPDPDRTFTVYVDPDEWDATMQLLARCGERLQPPQTTISDIVLGVLNAFDGAQHH